MKSQFNKRVIALFLNLIICADALSPLYGFSLSAWNIKHIETPKIEVSNDCKDEFFEEKQCTESITRIKKENKITKQRKRILKKNQMDGGGPSMPEVHGFTTVDQKNLVNPGTGDFNYSIPLLDVGGFPINIQYSSGIGTQDEASWVGLGWNLNPGSVSRQTRGLPDDFKGESITVETSIKPKFGFNVGTGVDINFAGIDLPVELGLGLELDYSNYEGWGVDLKSNIGLSAETEIGSSKMGADLGLSLGVSSRGGGYLNPSLSLSGTYGSESNNSGFGLNSSFQIDSREGLKSINFGTSFGNRHLPFGVSQKFSVGFASPTYTPPFEIPSHTTTGKYALKLDGTVYHFEIGSEISGGYSDQKIQNLVTRSAYGYMNSHHAPANALLDYNRENDGMYMNEIPNLPLTAHTYDLFSVNDADAAGTYRPYRMDVGALHDPEHRNTSDQHNIGIDISTINLVHVGVDAGGGIGKDEIKKWQEGNNLNSVFQFQSGFYKPAYEPVYFKSVSDLSVMQDTNVYNILGKEEPIRAQLSQSDPTATAISLAKIGNDNKGFWDINASMLWRENRDNRGKLFSWVTEKEYHQMRIDRSRNPKFTLDESISRRPGYFRVNQGNLIEEIYVTNESGIKTVFGLPVYNNFIKEVSFNIQSTSDAEQNPRESSTGLVHYGLTDATIRNTRGENNFFKSTTTPTHAYAWLITEKLSPDYVDVSNDGPTPDDLGTYSSFQYKKIHHEFKWRTPIDSAFFQGQSLHTENDNMGSYIFGNKEIYYLDKIKSRNFVAIFHTSPRLDGMGVTFEHGGINNNMKLHKLDSIQLFSEAMYNSTSTQKIPIKTVYFEYDYSLCKNQPNTHSSSADRGKLTLRKIYFTYGESNKHKQSPYIFHYSSYNPDYNPKAVDRWGNYKLPEQNVEEEFPYVKNNIEQNRLASSWHLDSIQNPMGGALKITYESDDYAYVQDRQAMNMMQIVGITKRPVTEDVRSVGHIGNLYTGDSVNRYLYFDNPQGSFITREALQRMISGISNLYFSVLVSVTNSEHSENPKFTRVSGFIPTNFDLLHDIGYGEGENRGRFWIKIPIVKIGSDPEINNVPEYSYVSSRGTKPQYRHPYTQAAFQQIMSSYPKLIKPEEESTIDREQTLSVEGIAKALSRFSTSFAEILDGGVFNYLQSQKRCEQMKFYDSYVRLNNPFGKKLGGGSRVKSIVFHDHWGEMQLIPDKDQNFFYGVEYQYEENHQSTGVAAYEPMIGKDENPFTLPVNYVVQRKLAIDINNYQVEPLGSMFFPSPQIIYSKVIQKNIPRPGVKKHATGFTVKEFYTAKDFPTITNKTAKYAIPKTVVVPLQFYNRSENTVTTTQGFTIEINDMHGKLKSSKEFDEYGNQIISEEYIYQTDANGKLDNYVNTINPSNGSVERRIMGLNYDLMVDASHHYTKFDNGGLQFNINFATYGVPIGITTPLPTITEALTEYRGLTFTKLIQRNGILKENRVTKFGQVTNGINEAFDAASGNVVVSSSSNDFDDRYYTVTLPAYWAYKEMGFESQNYRLTFPSISVSNSSFRFSNAASFFTSGDHLILNNLDTALSDHAWVYRIEGDQVLLIQQNGQAFTELNGDYDLRLINSGYANLVNESIGQYITLENPMNSGRLNLASTRILDSKANLFSDYWQTNFGYSTTIERSTCNCNPVIPEAKKGVFQNTSSGVRLTYTIQNFSEAQPNRIQIEASPGCFIEVFTQDGLPFEKEELNLNFTIPVANRNECHPQNILEATIQAKKSRIVYLTSECYPLIQCQSIPGERRTQCGLTNNIQNPFLTGIVGNYRALCEYVPFVKRSTNGRIYEKGFLENYDPFWTYGRNGLIRNSACRNWVRTDSVVAVNNKGQILESWNALNIPSSTYYQYGDLLQTAVAQNSYYNEMVYEGFENHSYNDTRTMPSGMHCLYVPHLRFASEMPADILISSYISSNKRHSGRNSLRVAPGIDFRTIIPILQRNLNRDSKSERMVGRHFTVQAEDIIVPFSPKSNEKYLFSAWIHQDNSNASNFEGMAVIINGERFGASGPIIDGWQQITGEFQIPSGLRSFTITLQANTESWIDDLRIQPLESQMNSFTYEPNTFLMLAKHDDLNFTNFFEYDASGNLERSKKETEYGIITISETRSELPKK